MTTGPKKLTIVASVLCCAVCCVRIVLGQGPPSAQPILRTEPTRSLQASEPRLGEQLTTVMDGVGEPRGDPQPYMNVQFDPPYNQLEGVPTYGGGGGTLTAGCNLSHATMDEYGGTQGHEGSVKALAAPGGECMAEVFVHSGGWRYNAAQSGGAVQTRVSLDNGQVSRMPANEGASAYVAIKIYEWDSNLVYTDHHYQELWALQGNGYIDDVDFTTYMAGFDWKTGHYYDVYVEVTARSTAGWSVDTGSVVNIDDVKIHFIQIWSGVEECGNNMYDSTHIALSYPIFCLPSTSVSVSGSLYSPEETVVIICGGAEVATAETDAEGSFTTSFSSPPDPGMYVVRAEDDAANSAEAPLYVIRAWVAPPPIPALSQWHLIAMTLLLGTAGTLAIRRAFRAGAPPSLKVGPG